MSSKTITIFRASNGYIFTDEDRYLIELFSEGDEGNALGRLLQRLNSELSTGEGFTLNVLELTTENPPEKDNYVVQKRGTGFVIFTYSGSAVCRGTADLHKFLGDIILSAAENYIDGEDYTIIIPTKSLE